ncbi:diacylglycerol acyltransferase [Cokeromyces recurvatus]|uniref:diacylglycerol acyltransferase n=1 Tax=Cokeromyces recurvatus TaxID=90255 RepID=UPI0022208805|nr:diacylglycerol acyltransferase [Cokeromyces recurvatus]KAI7905377.1 diacylglycerol acyltransferase [Cokeromyces recurvatus]
MTDSQAKHIPSLSEIKHLSEQIPEVQWAPVRGIPFERRVQTAVVLAWIFLLGNCLLSFTLSLFFAFLWPFHIAYIIYLWLDPSPENGGRRSEWFRELSFWKYFANYFPINLVKESDLDPSKNYIFGYHPHGIISMGAFANFGTEATGFSRLFPGIQPSLLTLKSNFNIPLYRDIILALGLASVSRRSCERILASGPGRSIVIVIGGASESLNARPGVADLILKKRLGFIKLAIKQGADLVPTFSFGENDLYEQIDNSNESWLWRIQKKMQQAVGFTLPLFHARGVFNYNVGLLPYRHPVVTVVGKPISVPKLKEGQTEPTEDQLKETQDLYIKELEFIYNKYKDVYAKDRKQELRIIS